MESRDPDPQPQPEWPVRFSQLGVLGTHSPIAVISCLSRSENSVYILYPIDENSWLRLCLPTCTIVDGIQVGDRAWSALFHGRR